MKPLKQLLYNITVQQLIGKQDLLIEKLCLDSREVVPGSLFVAIQGNSLDGHQYITQAIEKGSVAIVCETLPALMVPNITYLCVDNASQTLGLIARNFYDNPSSKLQLIAVTGTSGKTSTVHLLYGLFKKLGYSVGMLSTIHHKIDDQIFPTTLTTPHTLQINQLLSQMVHSGCQYCFMEASSHAIVQYRMTGLHLAGALFLNISHEHLDYHLTFDAYIKAKKMLFDGLPTSSFALYNADDKRGKIMVQNTAAKVHHYALQHPAEFRAKVLNNTWEGLTLRINGQDLHALLLGSFNGYNLLAAYATALLLQQDSHDTLVALSSIKPIPGRFQHIRIPPGLDVIIDYAHKPDSLEKVLVALQQIRKNTPQPGRMITVVGCGGNRDTQKRPLMAQIGYALSDQLILTSDNPRYEDPTAIIEAMKQGLTQAEQSKTRAIVDRSEAIKVAYQLARPGDIILIAGKGSENYQEIAGIKYPLSDEALVASLITSAP